MINNPVSHCANGIDFAALPNELIHSQSKRNGPLRPYLIRGRELSNPYPAYIPYFFMLSEEAISELIKKIKTVRYLYRAKLEMEANAPEDLYLIFSGKVHVTNNEETKTYRIRETFPNKAEFAVLTAETGNTSQVKFERTEFSVIKKSEFVNWLLSCPDVSFGYLGI